MSYKTFSSLQPKTMKNYETSVNPTTLLCHVHIMAKHDVRDSRLSETLRVCLAAQYDVIRRSKCLIHEEIRRANTKLFYVHENGSN